MDRQSANHPGEYRKELAWHVNNMQALVDFLANPEVQHAAGHYKDVMAYEGILDKVCETLDVDRYDAIVDEVQVLQRLVELAKATG
ncbi:hypothetical protein SEA_BRUTONGASTER_77 [Gordonia phage BrutonGaster]|uniref:Uncharacterized protein n=1 Tax=Gordonia phage BrutonGaster TaxID=2530116 RepID=A0A482JN62_9CAUD|nr:hypothetical protein HOV26_gp105 [Gordonia phage BrutonGaster]QBP33294.1 hypothetical protein SEA_BRUTONGASTER_77 [Gordonia phage BrutonGaster]